MSSPTAYERISSICAGFTDRSPRTTFTNTGKKQSTAAITMCDVFVSGLNHAFVIGANAMIGTAFAAIAYGINAVAEQVPAGDDDGEQRCPRRSRSRSRRAPPGT